MEELEIVLREEGGLEREVSRMSEEMEREKDNGQILKSILKDLDFINSNNR
jgi:hypothetical protein